MSGLMRRKVASMRVLRAGAPRSPLTAQRRGRMHQGSPRTIGARVAACCSTIHGMKRRCCMYMHSAEKFRRSQPHSFVAGPQRPQCSGYADQLQKEIDMARLWGGPTRPLHAWPASTAYKLCGSAGRTGWTAAMPLLFGGAPPPTHAWTSCRPSVREAPLLGSRTRPSIAIHVFRG